MIYRRLEWYNKQALSKEHAYSSVPPTTKQLIFFSNIDTMMEELEQI